MTHKISIVVATKDRPDDLRRLLESLRQQTVNPAEIVVVDASRESVESIVTAFPELRRRYVRHWPPSAAAQRNAGIRACDPSATLIAFADDDTTFEPDSFAAMLRFWEIAGTDVLGASFNMLNSWLPGGQSFKRSRISARLGLYPARLGGVAPSGWQSVFVKVSETQFVEWLPSGALVWRRDIMDRYVFDEYFDTYSYVEDLDFSYSIGRKGRLAVVAEAGYSHFPSAGGRVSPRQFGRLEVRNRLYFVRKHGLSLPRCFLGIGIRLAMTLVSALHACDRGMLARAVGNVEGLLAFRPRARRGSPCSILNT
jgi:GT2 family glycosyltransferase